MANSLKAGDTAALIRLAGGASQQSGPSVKGTMRPDARDLINNAGNSLADPYRGNFPWVVPPQAGVQIHAQNSIPAPANGTQALVTSFQCPQAMEAVITGVVFEYDGANPPVPGDGTLIWTLDINRPLGATQQGYNPPGWGQITSQLGSVIRQPFPIPGGIRLTERDFLRLKVLTAAPLGVGAPNFITGILTGWYYPVKLAFPTA